MKEIIKIRIVLWGGLVFLLGFFLWMGVVPFGKIVYIADFKSKNSFISKLTPKERVEFNKRKMPNIVIGDPIYFSLSTPRTFDKARLSLEYKNNSPQKLIEAGVLVDKVVWRYDLKPMENKIIDELIDDWGIVQEGGLLLLQKEKKFSSINEFRNNLPVREKIALYNTDIDQEYLSDNYQASADRQIIDYSLRGTYEFYTYIKDEDLDFRFIVEDLNQNKDSDEIDIRLYYQNQIIDSRHLDDDGIKIDNRQVSAERDINFQAVNLPEGVYKIEVKANDDIITKAIVTNQKKISFVNKLPLVLTDKSDFSIFTDGQNLSALTIDPASRQTIRSGEKELELSETYKQFETNIDSDEIKLEKDGVLLASDGVFSFSREAMINPKFKRVGSGLNLEAVDYILAEYKTPQKLKNGWTVATVEINLKDAYRENGKYSFIISIPGLKIEDRKSIELNKIRVELEGRSLLEKIKDIL